MNNLVKISFIVLYIVRSLISVVLKTVKQFSLFVVNSVKVVFNYFDSRFAGFRKCFYSVVCVCFVVTLLCSVFSVCGLTYALEVTVNGTNYGYVENADAAETAIDKLNAQVVADNASSQAPATSYSYSLTSSNTIKSSDELCAEIIKREDMYVTASIVYVNSKPFATADNIAVAEEFIFGICGDNAFYNDIKVKNCVIERDTYLALPDLFEVGDQSIPTLVEYTVRSGDSFASIAVAFGVSEELVRALNLSADLSSGSTVNIVVDLPVFTVIQTEQTTVSRNVSAAEAEGGKSGLIIDTVDSYYVMGVEYSTAVVDTRFEEHYANKPVASSIKLVGNAGFCWPVDRAYKNYVSSYWGDGRGHKAVDIACKKGVPILSVLDGYVESVNATGSGYGQHFVINHGNGLKTLYSHCSKLYVAVGDKVTRGEVVALVGSTGRSTGNHLHFEVFRNGARVNPCYYLGI